MHLDCWAVVLNLDTPVRFARPAHVMQHSAENLRPKIIMRSNALHIASNTQADSTLSDGWTILQRKYTNILSTLGLLAQLLVRVEVEPSIQGVEVVVLSVHSPNPPALIAADIKCQCKRTCSFAA